MEREFESEPTQTAKETKDPKPSTDNPPGLHVTAGNQAFSGLVQRSKKKSQGSGPLDEDIASEINGRRGAGEPMADNVQADMEQHLGVGLENVRVHNDSSADALSRSVNAEAFTTGTDVFFQQGKYSPDTPSGKGLLAHELTHVVQQSEGRGGPAGTVSHPSDTTEVEAKRVGDSVASDSTPAQAARNEAEMDNVDGGQDAAVSPVLRQEAEEEEEELGF